MFGYIVVNKPEMKFREFDMYQSYYCGLCKSLKDRYGKRGQMTLSYDMTFVALLLTSLYEPETASGYRRCVAHPVEKHLYRQNEFTDYAADMNLALAYHKCKDDWIDDRSVAAAGVAKLFESKYLAISERYPRQCSAMEEMMYDLRQAELCGEAGADHSAALFGKMMGEMFVWREDRWSECLRAMGQSLGEFIYIMDACMDLDADAKRKRYNPFMQYHGSTDNEQRFRDILKMILGQCVWHFDRLPLVQDAGILKNILCAGLWAQFEKKYSNKKGPSNDSGSV